MDSASGQAPFKELVTYFQRHAVPVMVVLDHGGEETISTFMTFLASVRGQWILVTAGHCITGIAEALRSGYVLKRARLLDAVGPNARHREPLPFDYLASLPCAPFSDDKFDCGFLQLGFLDRAGLKANGVVPIDERAWQDVCPEPMAFGAAGFIASLSDVNKKRFRLSMVLVPIDALPDRPPEFEATHAPRWYGRVWPSSVNSLVGLSGSPVFAFRWDEQKQSKYWLHGIQSAQCPGYPNPPFVAVCLAKPLLAVIAEELESKSGSDDVGGKVDSSDPPGPAA